MTEREITEQGVVGGARWSGAIGECFKAHPTVPPENYGILHHAIGDDVHLHGKGRGGSVTALKFHSDANILRRLERSTQAETFPRTHCCCTLGNSNRFSRRCHLCMIAIDNEALQGSCVEEGNVVVARGSSGCAVQRHSNHKGGVAHCDNANDQTWALLRREDGSTSAHVPPNIVERWSSRALEAR